MTEEELISLDFEKVDILDEDSQNGFDFYFYQKEICPGISLNSTDSIDVKNNDWSLGSHEIPALKIKDKISYQKFFEIIKSITL